MGSTLGCSPETLQVFIEMNKCIFVVVRSKVSNMQTKKKIHAWADLEPPQIWKKTAVTVSIVTILGTFQLQWKFLWFDVLHFNLVGWLC